MAIDPFQVIQQTITYLRDNLANDAGVDQLEEWVCNDLRWPPLDIGSAISVYGQEENVDRHPLLQAYVLLKLVSEKPDHLFPVGGWRKAAIEAEDETLVSRLGGMLSTFQGRYRKPDIDDINFDFATRRRVLGRLLVSGGRLTSDFLKLLKSWAKEVSAQGLRNALHRDLAFSPSFAKHGDLTWSMGTMPRPAPQASFHDRLDMLNADGFLPPAPTDPVRVNPSTVKEKIKLFEQMNRRNIILSGHGAWVYDPKLTDWPVTTLKKGQTIRFYVGRGRNLTSWLGQCVDNRVYVRPVEVLEGPRTIWNYTLFPQDKTASTPLVAGNKSVGDKDFVTVDKPTMLSTFLGEYARADFHWCACREYRTKAKDQDASPKRMENLSGKSVRWNPRASRHEIFVRLAADLDDDLGSVDRDDEVYINGWLEIPDCDYRKTLEKTKGLHSLGFGKSLN